MLMPILDLRPDPKNARVHNDRDLSAVAASLSEYGQRKPIVALRDGTVIAGNGTMEAARLNGWTHVAVVPFDDVDKARAYSIADNRTAELSGWDDGALAEALEELNAGGVDLAALGFDDDEFAKVVASQSRSLELGGDDADRDGVGKGASVDPMARELRAGQIPSGSSHVRMVQLFFTDTTHPDFMQRTRHLAGKWGTDNVTDTVLKAVQVATADDDTAEE